MKKQTKRVGVEIFDGPEFATMSDEQKQHYIDLAYQDIEDTKNKKSYRKTVKNPKDLTPQPTTKELKKILLNQMGGKPRTKKKAIDNLKEIFVANSIDMVKKHLEVYKTIIKDLETNVFPNTNVELLIYQLKQEVFDPSAVGNITVDFSKLSKWYFDKHGYTIRDVLIQIIKSSLFMSETKYYENLNKGENK
jgi:hypothetical protein